MTPLLLHKLNALTEMLIEAPPYKPRTPIVHGKSVKSRRGRAGARVPGSKQDSSDARVAELRKRYKMVKPEDTPPGRVSNTDRFWF